VRKNATTLSMKIATAKKSIPESPNGTESCNIVRINNMPKGSLVDANHLTVRCEKQRYARFEGLSRTY